jgi:hypothetical protein
MLDSREEKKQQIPFIRQTVGIRKNDDSLSLPSDCELFTDHKNVFGERKKMGQKKKNILFSSSLRILFLLFYIPVEHDFSSIDSSKAPTLFDIDDGFHLTTKGTNIVVVMFFFVDGKLKPCCRSIIGIATTIVPR